MNTRTAAPGAPLSQGRYMSSPEFAALRGVSGAAAAARAAIIPNPEKRGLIWFLQGLSIAEGGLRKVAADLLAMFPGSVPDKEVAMQGTLLESPFHSDHEYGEPSLEQFLIDLCINPRIQIRFPGEVDYIDSLESELAAREFCGLSKYDITPARISYFKDIVEALIEYKRRREEAIRQNFTLTAIGRKIWQTLDYALATKNMVLVDGLEGRGKTEAAKAWCELHRGEARFVSLKGINNKTTAFREIAKSLGIASGYAYKSTQLQHHIEDVLQRSKLMIVLDEAHFIFNQRQRIYTRPELVDWIDTAFCNQKIPLALVTTPQFMVCMTRAADQVDWNYRQFRRRVKRYEKLPDKNSTADIEMVACRCLPGASASAIKLVLGYAMLSKRDLSAVGDVVDEIKVIQNTDAISKVTFDQVKQAIDEHLIPSDTAFAEALRATENKLHRRHAKIKPEGFPEACREQAPAETHIPSPGALAVQTRSRIGQDAKEEIAA